MLIRRRVKICYNVTPEVCMDNVTSKINMQDLALDFFRICLGAALFMKGIYFIGHMQGLHEVVGQSVPYSHMLLSHFTILAHLVGGLCLVMGLVTRVAAAANIPIIFGAIAFVHIQEGLFSPGYGLELATLMLMALVIFTIRGSGAYSADSYLTKAEAELEAAQEMAEVHEIGEAQKIDDDIQQKAA